MVLALGLLVTSVAPLTGQSNEGPRRHGFWLSGGAGYGSARITCSQCEGGDREDGVSGFLALGGTLSPHWLLGFESSGWYKREGSVGVTIGTGTLSARYYPSETGGFFLKGGAGLAAWIGTDGSRKEEHDGFGLLAGMGFDVPVGRSVSLTPTVSYSGGWLGTVDGIEGVQQNVLQLALAITAH
jgi:hypothetical protein